MFPLLVMGSDKQLEHISSFHVNYKLQGGTYRSHMHPRPSPKTMQPPRYPGKCDCCGAIRAAHCPRPYPCQELLQSQSPEQDFRNHWLSLCYQIQLYIIVANILIQNTQNISQYWFQYLQMNLSSLKVNTYLSNLILSAGVQACQFFLLY